MARAKMATDGVLGEPRSLLPGPLERCLCWQWVTGQWLAHSLAMLAPIDFLYFPL